MRKSSGQFIYASVVMSFVADEQLYPPDQLVIALSLGTSTSATSSSIWTPLDSMYLYIFSRLKPESTLQAKFLISIRNSGRDYFSS